MAVGIGIQPKEYTEHYNLFGDYFYKVLKKPSTEGKEVSDKISHLKLNCSELKAMYFYN